jgi:hypothetical protein
MKKNFIFIYSFLLFFMLSGVCLAKKMKSPEDFLKSYGLTAKYKAEFNTTLPKKFIQNSGEYPIVLYWAFNNELSKKIGLDISLYKGKEVTVKFYTVEEDLPQACAPFTKGAAIVVMYKNKKIIGSWIAAVNSACSLDKKYINFQNICGQDFYKWVLENKIVDFKNSIEQSLTNLEPKDLIKKFIDSLNYKDYRQSFTCFELRYLLNMLFFDIETKGKLENDFTNIFLGELYRINNVEIKSIKELPSQDEYKIFEVVLNINYKNAGISTKKFIFMLRKESQEIGFRIANVIK